jgi:hypothetical protein
VLIDYVTGAALLVAADSVLLNKKTRTVTTGLGAWILLTVLAIHGPVASLSIDPDHALPGRPDRAPA